jgi:hypothetical protein
VPQRTLPAKAFRQGRQAVWLCVLGEWQNVVSFWWSKSASQLAANCSLPINQGNSVMRTHLVTVGLLALAGSQLVAAEQAQTPAKTPAPILCRGHYHSEEDAVKQLARMADTFSNLEEW